jgi:hypothetical protein
VIDADDRRDDQRVKPRDQPLSGVTPSRDQCRDLPPAVPAATQLRRLRRCTNRDSDPRQTTKSNFAPRSSRFRYTFLSKSIICPPPPASLVY